MTVIQKMWVNEKTSLQHAGLIIFSLLLIKWCFEKCPLTSMSQPAIEVSKFYRERAPGGDVSTLRNVDKRQQKLLTCFSGREGSIWAELKSVCGQRLLNVDDVRRTLRIWQQSESDLFWFIHDLWTRLQFHQQPGPGKSLPCIQETWRLACWVSSFLSCVWPLSRVYTVCIIYSFNPSLRIIPMYLVFFILFCAIVGLDV